MKISIIIPFLNEEENISVLVKSLDDYLARQTFESEVIFVDDGSTDRSLEKLLIERPSAFSARVISFSRNFGSHAALRAGVSVAVGDYITFVYADLQDPLELISRMAGKMEEKNDIVWASRSKTNNSFSEKAFSEMYSTLMKKYVSVHYPAKGFDVMMFNRKVADVLNQNIENNSSIFLQVLTMGFRQVFITYEKQLRARGKSKWTLSKKIKLFVDSFVAFSYAPIRFVTMVGILLFFLGILFSCYLVIRKILWNDLESGWPMLISILTIGFGVTNISLGILAEYLWRTLDVSRKRPVFIISQIVDLQKGR